MSVKHHTTAEWTNNPAFGISSGNWNEDHDVLGLALSSHVHSGAVILLYSDEADSSETNTSTGETEKKSWTLPANSYSKIIVESEVRCRVEQDASAKCDFTWRVKLGGVTQKTFVQRIIASATTGIDSGGRNVLTVKTSFNGGQTGNTAISLTGQMNLSNAATGILAHSLRVYGVV